MSFIGTLASLEKNSTTRKVTYETIPVVPEVPVTEISPVTGQKDSNNREFSQTSQMVGGFTKSYGRCSYPSSCSQHTGIHRCLPKKLGSSLKRDSAQWPLVKQGSSASHQCTGAKSCPSDPKGASGALTRSNSAHLFRQQHSSVLPEQRRRHTFHRKCALIWRILAFTKSRRIQIRARHVPGSLNVMADSLSRRDKVRQTEWSLCQQIFNQICKVWHTPMVDLFATHLNHTLPIYVSPVPDKKAWKIDALNICWEGLDGYVFCPVAILPQGIKKIITYPCRMIVLAPGWPVMQWFWDLVDLSTRVPLQLPHWKTLLKQPHSNSFHNNVEYLNLHVWLLDSRILI